MNLGCRTLLLGALAAFWASTQVAANCYDFSKGASTPLKPPIALLKTGDNFEKGRKDSLAWGAVRGVVNRPIEAILKDLLDLRTIKDASTNMKVTEVKNPAYLAFYKVETTVNPFLFISASWEEGWAYALKEGTKANPKNVVILYQKLSGTGHLEHLCGSIVIKKASAKETDLAFYEEVISKYWSEDKALENFFGTLRTLRGQPKPQ